MREKDEGRFAFLNVDLEVVGREDLSPMVRALSRKLFVLHEAEHAGVFHAHFEVLSQRQNHDADATIREFVRVLGTMTPTTKRIWKRASTREFNIGIQGGIQPRAYEIVIQPETVGAVASLGARLGITVYAYDEKYARRRKRRTT